MIVKTTSAGTTWQVINTGFPAESFTKIFFSDANKGYLLTYTSNILATTNSGLNWVQQVTGTAQLPQAIFFADANTGYIACGQGNILKTTNAGVNWNIVNASAGNFNSLYFINSLTGYGAGIWNGQANCKRTTDGGVNWENINTGTNNTVNDMAFTDAGTAYILGAGAMILKTTNAGSITNIQPVSNNTPEGFSLSQNYPNPFNPKTNIGFRIADFGFVSLKVFDVTGKEAAVLVNEELSPGAYNVDFDASQYSSGIYFYTMTTPGYSVTRKMVLVK